MSDNSQQSGEDSQMQQKASHWSELISKVIEKVIDKDVSVTYTFDHLEIDVPSAHGPGGRELGGAKWVVDGKITIATTSTSSSSSPSSYSKGSSATTPYTTDASTASTSKYVSS
ncbi:MAG TPA: hypothetical protein VFX18_00525 [Candidatus Nitrosocosmicus sp.]|nr:hypothetical protein [Candidatus Nitrosocosmicus sp.]